MKKIVILIVLIILIIFLFIKNCNFNEYKNLNKKMVLVEGGTYKMGKNGYNNDEKPAHNVEINSFYIGKYEVTQKEYELIIGNNPSLDKGNRIPVNKVSWYDAIEYCNKLSEKEGIKKYYEIANIKYGYYGNINSAKVTILGGIGYRLPTEAEWEYAAMGGKNNYDEYKYSGGDNFEDVAWNSYNSNSGAHIVGKKQPNKLGIFDMTGNVWEWCWDIYDSEYYKISPVLNPIGAISGTRRVCRGGSWFDGDFSSRISNRYSFSANETNSSLGFRVVRTF